MSGDAARRHWSRTRVASSVVLAVWAIVIVLFVWYAQELHQMAGGSAQLYVAVVTGMPLFFWLLVVIWVRIADRIDARYLTEVGAIEPLRPPRTSGDRS